MKVAPYVVSKAWTLEKAWYWVHRTLPDLHYYAISPDFRRWERALADLTNTPEMADINQVVPQIVRDGTVSPYDFEKLIKTRLSDCSLETWYAAAKASADFSGDPFVSAILSLVALVGWATASGSKLYLDHEAERARFPGWETIPYECARSAMRAGALEAARVLAEYSYNIVLNQKTITQHTLLVLAKYRELGAEIHRRFRIAVANLATDLRESCRSGSQSFRAEVGALMWSAGFVPESQSMRSSASAGWIPSARLCRHLVAQSLSGLSIDVLQQFIWLKMRDRGPFDLRKHAELYTKINLFYHFGEATHYNVIGEAYANAITAWFAGTLTPDLMLSLTEASEVLAPMVGNVANVIPISTRCFTLIECFVKEITLPPHGKRFVKAFSAIQEEVIRWRRLINYEPILGEENARTTVPTFYFLEETRENASPHEAFMVFTSVLDLFRAPTLESWSKLVPTRPGLRESKKFQQFRKQEVHIIEQLRGAFFRTLYPYLPVCLRRIYYEYPYDIEFVSEEKQQKIDCMMRALKAFYDFYNQVRAEVPEYAASRLSIQPSREELIDCLNVLPRI